MTATTLRSATADEATTVAGIWHQGWHTAHAGRVPDELTAVRTLAAFHERTPSLLAVTTVAVGDHGIVGFVMVDDDEIEQLFVTPQAQGTGVATHLLSEGERQIAAAGHGLAWLAVVVGNARARRFYERSGWVDEGDLAYRATVRGTTYLSPCRRYTRRLG